MLMVPWRVRLSCFVLVLIAGGSLAGASRRASEPVMERLPVVAHLSAMRGAPSPVNEPFPLEVVHGDEPGPPPRDVTGAHYPSGLTIDGATKRC